MTAEKKKGSTAALVWHPASELPKLEEQWDFDPDEGEYSFCISKPLILWCPDQETHRVVGYYLQDQGWAGYVSGSDSGPREVTHWMLAPEGPED